MPVDEFVKQYAPGPSFYNRLCNMVAETGKQSFICQIS